MNNLEKGKSTQEYLTIYRDIQNITEVVYNKSLHNEYRIIGASKILRKLLVENELSKIHNRIFPNTVYEIGITEVIENSKWALGFAQADFGDIFLNSGVIVSDFISLRTGISPDVSKVFQDSLNRVRSTKITNVCKSVCIFRSALSEHSSNAIPRSVRKSEDISITRQDVIQFCANKFGDIHLDVNFDEKYNSDVLFELHQLQAINGLSRARYDEVSVGYSPVMCQLLGTIKFLVDAKSTKNLMKEIRAILIANGISEKQIDMQA